LHIAIVGEFPLSRGEFRGGVEAITFRLAEGLAALGGVRLDVVSLTEEPGRTGVEEWGAYRVTRLAGSARFGNINFAIPDRARVRAALRAIRPDIAHAHSLGRFALGALESGLPTVISIHGVIANEVALERGLKNRLRYIPRVWVVDRCLARGSDFILVTPYIADQYRRELAGKRTYDLETSVDPVFFATPPHEEPPPGGPRVLQAGPLIPRKAALDLERAAPAILAAHPTARIRFAGGWSARPEYKAEIDRAVAEMGLDARVDFLGLLAPPALAEEMSRAACVVLPSLQETAPIAIQEAMAAGRPVVASRVGGNPHLVKDGETGFVVPPGDPRALAERVVEMLGDRARRDAMGARARDEARRRFEMRAVAEASIAIYGRVIEAQSGGRAP
jgi:glycosyltransferase involved in cell wall biosynthesis